MSINFFHMQNFAIFAILFSKTADFRIVLPKQMRLLSQTSAFFKIFALLFSKCEDFGKMASKNKILNFVEQFEK